MIEEAVRDCMEEWCEKEGVKDLRRATQEVWTACMTYVGMTLFKKKDGFFHKRELVESESGVSMSTNGAQRDLGLIESGVEYYTYLCRVHNKVVTLEGVCNFLGISRQFFRDDRTAGDAIYRRKIKEKIYNASEGTAEEALLEGSARSKYAETYLARKHGWKHSEAVMVESSGDITELPDLSGYLLEKKDEEV